MDPYACLHLAIDAISRHDCEEATSCLDDLWNWIAKRGFIKLNTKLYLATGWGRVSYSILSRPDGGADFIRYEMFEDSTHFEETSRQLIA